MPAGRCKLRSFCFCLDRARELWDVALPTEVEMVEGCTWSVVKGGAEQNDNNPCVVETVSDCASSEAGFDEKMIEGGERKGSTGSIGCLKVDGINVSKSNFRSVKTGNESSLSFD